MTDAMLFDLDDTLLSAYGNPDIAWMAIAAEFASELWPIGPATAAAIIASGTARFLADEDNRRLWRLDAIATRRLAVRAALAELAAQDLKLPAPEIADAIADRYAAYRDERMHLFDNAHRVLDTLHQRGTRLGLITNGATAVQRRKILRFDLAGRFDHIQIEEEAGFGKPDARAYLATMAALGVTPEQTAMVGDDLLWDVEAPQRLNIYAIWHDVQGEGLPPDNTVRPDRIIRELAELVAPA